MVSTKWFQGKDNLNDVLRIREEFLSEGDKRTDFYDDFAFNAVVYNDDIPAGIGRLLFKEGKYFIDRIHVKSQFQNLNYEDLLIRMLVRKAVAIGADKTYIVVENELEHTLKNIGFKESAIKNNIRIMVKNGDVGGNCCV